MYSNNRWMMEFQNGLLAGLPYGEAARLYPKPGRRLPHESYHESESLITFRMRAEAALSRILCEAAPQDQIAVVSHGGLISRLFQAFLGLPVTAEAYIASGDTAIHHLRMEGGARHILFLNRQEHLTGHEDTAKEG